MTTGFVRQGANFSAGNFVNVHSARYLPLARARATQRVDELAGLGRLGLAHFDVEGWELEILLVRGYSRASRRAAEHLTSCSWAVMCYHAPDAVQGARRAT